MNISNILTSILVVLVVGGVLLLLIKVPKHDGHGDVMLSQSLTDPAFKQWETNSGYQVDTVEVYNNGRAVIHLNKIQRSK